MIIKVIIVDDHHAIRIGLSLLLADAPDVQVIGEAGCGIEALEMVSRLKPDIVLLDFRLPDISGSQVCVEIQKQGLSTRVLGFSAFSNEEFIIEMLDAGAEGYVLKTEAPNTLLDAIRTVAGGETWLSPMIANKLLNSMKRDSANHSILSPRELEVLKLLAKGYSNIQIARSLTISRATVKNHLSNIYDNLAVGSRAEAIVWAWSNGLIAKELPKQRRTVGQSS